MIYLILCILGLCVQAVFIKVEKEEKFVGAVLLKGTASAIFVILGYLTSRHCTDVSFAKSVFIGLCFGMGGDILLNLRWVFKKQGMIIFLVGILIFLSGHIFYLAALIPLCQNLPAAIVCGIVATVIILLWIFKNIEAKPAFKIFGVFYIGAIVIMTTIAIFNYAAAPSTNGLIYMAGALLFTASDIILIFNTFGKESKFSLRVANLMLYYLGQLCIALSLLWR